MTEQVTFTGNRQLRWLMADGCLITFIEAEVQVSDEQWDEWLESLEDPSCGRCLLCSTGDIEPSKAQWKRATQVMRKTGKIVSIVSDSKPTAARAKAASWLGLEIKAFRWSAIYDAVMFLQLETSEQRIGVRQKAEALRDHFGESSPKPSAPAQPASFDPTRTPPSRTFEAASPTPRPPMPSASWSRPTPSANPPTTSTPTANTPMAASASRNLEETRRTSEEMRAKLAEIQARLRASRIRK